MSEVKKTTKKFVDKSKYAKKHKEISDYIKRQTNIDIDEYRDGDGSSPYSTSYWEKQGGKVAVDWKRMPQNVKNSILGLKGIKVEDGGAWISYISRLSSSEKKKPSRSTSKTVASVSKEKKDRNGGKSTKRNTKAQRS